MKKILYLSMILVFVFSCFSLCVATTFYDTLDTKYEGVIEGLAYLKIVNGTEEHIFEPNKPVTRAEMAKMLVISHGYDKNMDMISIPNSFRDVKKDDWFYDYVGLASAYGLIKGYPDGKFYPDREVTYAEVVAMILRSLGHSYIKEDSEFGWAHEYILRMRELKLNKGIPAFQNDEIATRGDVAVFIWNMLNSTTWHVVKETDGIGFTYADSREILFDRVFGDDYDWIDNKRVREISVSDGSMYAKIDGMGDVELEGVLPIYALGANLNGIYDKNEKKVVSFTYDMEYALEEGYIEELEEAGYTLKGVNNKISAVGSKSDYGYLLLEREGSKDVVRRIVTLDLSDKVKIDSIKKEKEKVTINEDITIDTKKCILLDGKKEIDWSKLEKGDQILCVEGNALYLYVTDYKEPQEDEEEKEQKETEELLYYVSNIAYMSNGGAYATFSNGKVSKTYRNVNMDKLSTGDLVVLHFEKGKLTSVTSAKKDEKDKEDKEYDEGSLALAYDNLHYENHMLGKYIVSEDTKIYKVSKIYADNSSTIIENCNVEKVNETALEDLENVTVNIVYERNQAKIIFIEKEVNKFSVFYARVKEIIIDKDKINVKLSPLGSSMKVYETAGLIDFDEGDIISYTLTDKDILRVVEVYRSNVIGYEKDYVVKDVGDGGREAILQGGLRLNVREATWNDTYEWEDYKVIQASVKYVEDRWKFTAAEFVAMKDVRWKEGDRIAIDELEGVVVIYRGYEE